MAKDAKLAMHAAATAVNPIVAGIVQAVEAALNAIVTDPTAKSVLQALESWINALLGIGPNTVATASANLTTVAAVGGPFIQAIVAMLEKMLANLSPAVLQAILAYIMSLLAKTP